jgi:hypothetical protein
MASVSTGQLEIIPQRFEKVFVHGTVCNIILHVCFVFCVDVVLMAERGQRLVRVEAAVVGAPYPRVLRGGATAGAGRASR